MNIKGQYYSLFVRGSLEKPSAKIVAGADVLEKNALEKSIETKFSFDGVHVSLSFKDKSVNNGVGAFLLNGEFYAKFGTIEGQGLSPDGTNIQWSAIRRKEFSEKENGAKVQVDSIPMSRLWFPNLAYGLDSIPKHNSYLIRNATIWTGEKDEVIENGDVLVVNGKIKHVGTGSVRVPDGTKVIDAQGKFVTAGIIDEHSHIAISKGVNESGLSITSEVSIQTVINPDDVNIYRQLAGGVTCSQLLHGSANAIGGQSALIKLKWGYDADGLLLKDQPKFIKFALGENVKQANWGDFNVTRFPQTRMGVEQVYYDAFYRAKYYHQDAKGKGKTPFRRDLRLEALAEILNGERHITCHSYVQSEINMLMKVADSMGFKINTFTHILEGYKLTEQMAKHCAGGSTFSDWWAYKYEVIDAIPHNACMMNKAGIVTAINSDDAEMGRRLNQEAAKGVKYGGMTEQEAWRMVTINPAKLLRIDSRVGSIKEGKDADLVIWSHNPLSVDAICEKTFIDGILFFDIRQQEARQKRNEKERVRLIALMQEAIKKGASPVAFIYKHQPLYHCDTEEHHTHHHHGH
jgi:imidazolonepropionase-like amidohydrolase